MFLREKVTRILILLITCMQKFNPACHKKAIGVTNNEYTATLISVIYMHEDIYERL